MRIEMMPGLDNVIRFPIERRAPATLELLYDIAPDVREVLYMAEAFAIEAPEPDLYQTSDRVTAERIFSEVPAEPGRARQAVLAAMRDDLIVAAVDACRAAHDAGAAANEAHQRLIAAKTGSCWRGDVDYLGAQADRMTCEAAGHLIMAHIMTEQARGGVRAIDIARRGDTWKPHSSHEATAWLIGEREAG